MARRKVPREELISDYKRVSDKLGKLPTLGEYNEHGNHTQNVVYRLFDSIKDLREVAGMRRGDYKYTRAELVEDLQRVGDIVGRGPRLLEYREYGNYSDDTLLVRLGGNWGSALKAAGFDPEGHAASFDGNRKPSIKRQKKTQVACDRCGDQFSKVEIALRNSKRHFCSNECHHAWKSEQYSGLDGLIAGEQIEVTCEYCGKNELKPPSKARNHRFCSKTCLSDWQSEHWRGEQSPRWNRIEKECEGCGEPFSVIPSQEHAFNYCSAECRYEHTHVEIECAECGEPYMQKASRADGSRFCSRDCLDEWRSKHQTGENAPNWKGGYVRYYGPNWYRQRRRCLERDDHCCVICGRDEEDLGQTPDVHHIVKFRTFVAGDTPTPEEADEANRLDNLVTLCRDHHKAIEGMGLLPSDVADAMAD